jgi:hypothetical protein
MTYLDYMYQSYSGDEDYELITDDPTSAVSYKYDDVYWKGGRTYTNRLQAYDDRGCTKRMQYFQDICPIGCMGGYELVNKIASYRALDLDEYYPGQ